MTVPLSDDVAKRVPVELMERKEMGDLCASRITSATVNVRVEKSITSPDCWAGAEAWAGAGCWESGDVGEGTGEGYAR